MESQNACSGDAYTILVTGANKGIGFACLERFIQEHASSMFNLYPSLEIILTSRNSDAGEECVKLLQEKADLIPGKRKHSVKMLQLDLNDATSRDIFVQKCPLLSVLINNSGIMYPGRHLNETIIANTMNTNYRNTKKLTQALLTAGKIKNGGKIIFVSSKLGDPIRISSKHPQAAKLLEKYTAQNSGSFTEQDLENLVGLYDSEVKDSKLKSLWPNSVYAVSKLCITLFAKFNICNIG